MIEQYYKSFLNYKRIIDNFFARKWLVRMIVLLFGVTIVLGGTNAYAQSNTVENQSESTQSIQSTVTQNSLITRDSQENVIAQSSADQTTSGLIAQSNTTTATSSECGFIDLLGGYKEGDKVLSTLHGTDSPNIANTTNNQLIAATSVFLINVAGVEGFTNCQALLNDPNISPISKNGVQGMLNESITTALLNPPSINVYQHLAQDWVPGYSGVNSTFAASGYEYLQGLGISGLWETFRNLAYILFVLILIITGFMIMFRQKIGGQVAITLFNSIPNIVIGLVLVTFSFAIVGIILNLGVLLMQLIAGWLGTGNYVFVDNIFALVNTTTLQNAAMNSGGLNLFTDFWNMSLNTIGGVQGLLTGIVGSPVILIMIIVLFFVYVYVSVKIYITLLRSFISIILGTIFAPVQLALSVIPGNSAMRGNWFRDILRNTLVFPVVFFMVNLPIYLDSFRLNTDPTGMIRGDLGYTPQPGLVEFIMGVAIPLILYYMAAEVPKMLTDFLPQNSGRGAQEALGAAMGGLKKIPLVGSFM